MLADNSSYAFNEIIKLGVEHGLLGLLLGLSILGILLLASNNSTLIEQNSDDCRESGFPIASKKNLLLLAQAGILSILIFGLFSYPSAILPIKMNFVLFAAIIASICSHQNEKQKHKGASIASQDQLFYHSSASSARRLPLFLSVVLLAILVLTYPVVKIINRQYSAQHYWKDASDIYRIQAYQECLEDFELAYPQLKHNGDFLVQYGKALNMAGENEKAIEILEQAKQYLNNSILYTALGDSQKNLGKIYDAEQAYLQASQMLPSRFFPLYLLAKLYDENEQEEKAIKLANQLMNKKVKVPSKAIEEIKEEMRQITDKYEETEPEVDTGAAILEKGKEIKVLSISIKEIKEEMKNISNDDDEMVPEAYTGATMLEKEKDIKEEM